MFLLEKKRVILHLSQWTGPFVSLEPEKALDACG